MVERNCAHNTTGRLSGSSCGVGLSDWSGASESKRVRPFAESLTVNTASDERGVNVDLLDVTELAKLEKAEAEIDLFIEKRAREAGDANAIEALWAESVRRHHARRREENRLAWVAFHRHMVRLHASLSAEHRERAEALLSPGAS